MIGYCRRKRGGLPGGGHEIFLPAVPGEKGAVIAAVA